jgi:hypothetical protein
VNVLAQGLQKSLAAQSRWNPEDAVYENHQDRNDQGNLFVEILIHRPASLVQKVECKNQES